MVKHLCNVSCIHSNRVGFRVQIPFDKTPNYHKLLFRQLEPQGTEWGMLWKKVC